MVHPMSSRPAPYAAFLDQWPTAVGPGEYTDQASSFLPAAGDQLPPGLLERVLGEQEAPMARRSNPPADDAVVPTDDLTGLAAMTTGMWGPGMISVRHEVAPGRMRLPVIANDSDAGAVPGRYEPFWDRMTRLYRALGDLEKALPGRYDRVYARSVPKLLRSLERGADKAEVTKKLRSLGYDARGRRRQDATADQPWRTAVARMRAAVGYVLRQKRSSSPSLLGDNGLPFGFPIDQQWSVIAPDGNKKLPFYAYSELPMATCAGAGACGVPFTPAARRRKRDRGLGWCYSFRAWRYPAAFERQFLNTLANYADREFAIIAGANGESISDPRADYDRRVQASIRGNAVRQWPSLVRDLVLTFSRRTRERGAVSYLRLFVDGDIGPEDCIVQWMEVCRDLGPDAPDRAPGSGWIEVYGYSKEWGSLVNVDGAFRDHLTAEQRADAAFRNDYGRWPRNYTFNLSSGSVYEATGARSVRARTETLPVARGYFVAIDISQYIEQLARAEANLDRLPDPSTVPFAFNADRIRGFVAMNAISSEPDGGRSSELAMIAKARRVLERRGGAKHFDLRFTVESARDFVRDNGLAVDVGADASNARGWRTAAAEIEQAVGADVSIRVIRPTPSNPTPKVPTVAQQIRRQAWHAFVENLLTDENFAQLVRDEVGKDSQDLNEEQYLRIASRRSADKTGKILGTKGGGRSLALQDVSDKQATDKALALVLHETLWVLNAGGSCPLICGNCSDVPRPTLETPGVHRCASKGAFRDRDISIGIH
jgi:hypothetical protein